MKVFRYLLLIISIVISVARLVSHCSKERKLETAKEYSNRRNSVEKARQTIFNYNKNDIDSLQWMTDHARAFNATLDSSIKYYRDNFNDDNREKYTRYLNVFFEYKKLLYAYQSWIKYNKENVSQAKNGKDLQIKLSAYRQQLQSIAIELRRNEFEVSMNY